MSSVEKNHVEDRDSEDDGMPDLESVGSSEYSDDDNKDDEKTETNGDKKKADSNQVSRGSSKTNSPSPDPASNGTVLNKEHDRSFFRHWLYEYLNENVKVTARKIKVQLLSPFLFGMFSISDKWIGWLFETGLLPSKSEFNTDQLQDQQLLAVETVERAANVASPYLDTCPHEERYLFTKLVDIVQPCVTVKDVVTAARELPWFRERAKLIVPPSCSKTSPPNEYFFDMALIYAIIYTVKKSESDVEIMEEEPVSKEAEKCREMGHKNCKEEFFVGAIEDYSMAINLCPYSYKAYGDRAKCYLRRRRFRAAISDGYRYIVLNPDGWEGYSRFSCGLYCMDDRVKAECIHYELQTQFPNDRIIIDQEWEECSAYIRGYDVEEEDKPKKEIKELREEQKKHEKSKKKGKAKRQQEKLSLVDKLIKKASLQAQEGNHRDAADSYGSSLEVIADLKGKWQSGKGNDATRSLALIWYAQALELLELGTEICLHEAIQLFKNIKYKFSPFPGAFLGTARCLMKLKRFKEAERELYQGLTILTIYKKSYVTMNWPGTNVPIDQLKPSVLENDMRRLREYSGPYKAPEAICRSTHCPSLHLTTNIYLDELDIKGYVTLKCSEMCSTSMHYDCWKKTREDLVISSDRDMLGRGCLTEDCDGILMKVDQTDGHGTKYKLQHSVEPKEPKKAEIVKENRQPISSVLHMQRVLQHRREWRERKKMSQNREKPVMPEKSELTPEQQKKPFKLRSSEANVDERSGSDMLLREEKMAEEEKKNRINKKKKSKMEDKSNSAAVEIAQLFTAPLSDGRNTISANDDIDQSGNVIKPELSPEVPFTIPAHLKNQHQQFEQTVSPQLGLNPDFRITNNDEMLFSYFEQILKEHGPMKTTHPTLEDALNFLPDVSKEYVTKRGGLIPYLRYSPDLAFHGELICTKEDGAAVAASMKLKSDPLPNVWGRSNPTTIGSLMGKAGKTAPLVTSGRGKSEAKVKPALESESSQISLQNFFSSDKDSEQWPLADTPTKSNSSSGSQGLEPTSFVAKNIVDTKRDKSSSPEDRVASQLGSDISSSTQSPVPSVAVARKQKSVQTDRIKRVSTLTMTEPMASDNFKHMYETAARERDRLAIRVRELEDERVKLKRALSVDMDRTVKAAKSEVRQELEEVIAKLREQYTEDLKKLEKEKKEKQDQLKATNKELKLTNERLEKSKRDYLDLEQEYDNQAMAYRTTLDKIGKDKMIIEERLKTAHGTAQRARERAIEADARLVQVEGDTKVKEIEVLLKEADVVSERTKKTEWISYRDTLRAILEDVKNKTTLQLQDVLQGMDYSSLVKINIELPPKPSLPNVMNPAAVMHAQMLQMMQVQALKNQQLQQRAQQQSIPAKLPHPQQQQPHPQQQQPHPQQQQPHPQQQQPHLQQQPPHPQQQPPHPQQQPPHPQQQPPHPQQQPPHPQQQPPHPQQQQPHPQQQQPHPQQHQPPHPQQHQPHPQQQMPHPQVQQSVTQPSVSSAVTPSTVMNSVPTSNVPLRSVSQPALPIGTRPGALAPPTTGTKKGVDRIHEILTSLPEYKDLDKNELRTALLVVKQENNNSLKTLSPEEIAERAKVKLEAGRQEAAVASSQNQPLQEGVPQSQSYSLSQYGQPSPPMPHRPLPSYSQPQGSTLLTAMQQPQPVASSSGGSPTIFPSAFPTSSSSGAASPMMMSGLQQVLPVMMQSRQNNMVNKGLPQGMPSGNDQNTQQSFAGVIGPQSGALQTGMNQSSTAADLQNHLHKFPVAVAPPPRQRPSEPFVYDEDECVICAEDMEGTSTLALDCGHKFHDHCIRQWLNEQSTCPTCRDHVLLLEDFPELS